MRTRLPFAGFIAIALLLMAVGLIPRQARAVGPMPACRLDDILTVPRGYDDWSHTLVDWILRVEEDYVPPDLVSVSDAGIAGPGLIRAVAIDDLRALAEAAAANGTPIEVNSPYRSYQEQVASFNHWVSIDGYDVASTYSMRPGHSEHQLGLTIDFQALGGPSALQGDWYTTPTGRWMYDNSWKYGWVLSYPLGEGGAIFSQATCFHYEPWHYRYLGREVAKAVHDSGLTIREYLWENYTMVDPVTGSPLPTPTPTPSPSPTPTATPSPTPTPTPLPTPTASPLPTPTPMPSASGGLAGMSPAVAISAGVALLLVLVVAAFFTRRATRRR